MFFLILMPLFGSDKGVVEMKFFGISLLLLGLLSTLLVIWIFFAISKVKITSGKEEMIGSEAEVIAHSEKGYRVLSHGEVWHAISKEDFEIGTMVEVASIKGLVLEIQSLKG
jgi:membrane protein implicated in regulation of membrane protease activity